MLDEDRRDNAKADWPAIISRVVGVAVLVAGVLLAAGLCTAAPQDNSVPSISIRTPTPADSIRHLSHFVPRYHWLIFSRRIQFIELCRCEIP